MAAMAEPMQFLLAPQILRRKALAATLDGNALGILQGQALGQRHADPAPVAGQHMACPGVPFVPPAAAESIAGIGTLILLRQAFTAMPGCCRLQACQPVRLPGRTVDRPIVATGAPQVVTHDRSAACLPDMALGAAELMLSHHSQVLGGQALAAATSRCFPQALQAIGQQVGLPRATT